jgi:hypothetical protein
MSQWMELSYIGAICLMIVILGSALVVLYLILVGRIDIKSILQEPDSTKASLSRFQFLLFTCVVARLFCMLSVEAGAFVNIPEGVLGLLGISAGSYAVSKGITANANANAKTDKSTTTTTTISNRQAGQ